MEKVPSSFLRYTARFGEPSPLKAEHEGSPPWQEGDGVNPRLGCRNRERKHVYEWHVSRNCKFPGFIGVCHNLSVTSVRFGGVFYYGSPSFPMAANISCCSFPLSLVTPYPLLLSLPRQDVLGGDS